MNCTLSPLKPTDQKKLRDFFESDAYILLLRIAVSHQDDAALKHTKACLAAPETQTGHQMAMATFKNVARLNTFVEVLTDLKTPERWVILEPKSN